MPQSPELDCCQAGRMWASVVQRVCVSTCANMERRWHLTWIFQELDGPFPPVGVTGSSFSISFLLPCCLVNNVYCLSSTLLKINYQDPPPHKDPLLVFWIVKVLQIKHTSLRTGHYGPHMSEEKWCLSSLVGVNLLGMIFSSIPPLVGYLNTKKENTKLALERMWQWIWRS